MEAQSAGEFGGHADGHSSSVVRRALIIRAMSVKVVARKSFRGRRERDVRLAPIGLAIGTMLVLALGIAAALTIEGLHYLHFKSLRPEPLLSAATFMTCSRSRLRSPRVLAASSRW